MKALLQSWQFINPPGRHLQDSFIALRFAFLRQITNHRPFITLDDPGAYSRPVQLKFTATHIRPDLDLMEFICLEDNEYGLAGGIVPANEGGQRVK